MHWSPPPHTKYVWTQTRDLTRDPLRYCPKPSKRHCGHVPMRDLTQRPPFSCEEDVLQQIFSAKRPSRQEDWNRLYDWKPLPCVGISIQTVNQTSFVSSANERIAD